VAQSAPERGELRADVGTRRLTGRAVGGKRGPGLEHQRLDLLPIASKDPCDLLPRDVAELGEDERDALVIWQPRDVGQRPAQVLAGDHLGGQTVDGRLGQLRDRPLAALGSTDTQRWRAIVYSHGRSTIGFCERMRSR
jgi:hypothetical protein